VARTVDIERVRTHAEPPSSPPPAPRTLIVKHALDRAVALGGLLVVAPIIAGVALVLRLRGVPVLRREERIGFRGRPLVVRSFALGDGPLARIGVTALPQLWSVFVGQMSIVGPRPREPGFEAPPARPGLTGLAQLEQLERWLSVAEQLELDEAYARTWSLALDARIVWRTLTSSGAGRTRPLR
jgi:lipopolysaccharide/colanic/teichoic acid biosynthesis glycosyltransferase